MTIPLNIIIIILILIICLLVIILIFKPFKTQTQCLHIWGEVEGAYQYCAKCGLGRTVGCNHKWKIEKSSTISRGTGDEYRNIGEEMILLCEKCTDRKYVRTELGKDPISKLL